MTIERHGVPAAVAVWLGTIALMLAPTPTFGTAISFLDDFESGTPPDIGVWSSRPIETTPVGAVRFLGRNVGDETTSLTFHDLPTHTEVSLSFELLVIGDWDGDEVYEPQNTPDGFSVSVDGDLLLLQATFSTNINPQSFPTPSSQQGSGASDINTLGYITPGAGPADAVYELDYLIPHTGDSLSVTFQADLDHPMLESWGLDNVRVEVVPEPVSLWLLVLGACLALAAAGRTRATRANAAD